MAEEMDTVCELLDKLYINMLDLIEQDVQSKINIEKVTNDGQLNLAKARYIKGPSTVSFAQLPTEDSKECNALQQTMPSTSKSYLNEEKLELHTNEIDKEKGFIDPANWFGILVPNCLQLSKNSYRKSLEYVIESVNIETALQNTLMNILKLRKLKSQF